MAKFRFRLKAGQHIQANRSKPILDANGKPTGRFEKQTFNVGDVIESDTDLMRHGAEHFELLSGPVGPDDQLGFRTAGDPSPAVAATSPSVAPGGQVSTGYQAAAPVRSRPMLPDEASQHGGGTASNAGEGEEDGNGDSSGLESMTVVELRAYAKQQGINLGRATHKEEILEAIRESS